MASFYQGLSWTSYTAGAVLSALIGGSLIDQNGPVVAFQLGAAGLFCDALCALMISEERQGAEAGPGTRGAVTKGVVLSAASLPPAQLASLQQRASSICPSSPLITGAASGAAAAAAGPGGGAWAAGRYSRKNSGLSSPVRGGAMPAVPLTPGAASAAGAGPPPLSPHLRVTVLDRVHRGGLLVDPSRSSSLVLPQDSLKEPLLLYEPGAQYESLSQCEPECGQSGAVEEGGGGTGAALVVLPLSGRDQWWRSTATLLGLVVQTIGQPQILVPALFVFLWQVRGCEGVDRVRNIMCWGYVYRACQGIPSGKCLGPGCAAELSNLGFSQQSYS